MAKALEFLELDFNDPNEAFIALNFSSVDFRELGKSKGSFSKTLIMPSTKKNDSFFGMSFDVSSEGFFDPLIKVPIRISEIEFYGVLQLKSIHILGGKPVSYSVNIFGDLSDWASLIGEGSIRGLKHHSEHILNAENIEASWDNTGVTGDYVYPLISYGNFLQDKSSTFNIDPAFWRPAFFALPLVRQIFKEAGYTFIDTGLRNTPLKNLILPFTSKEVELPNLEVIASVDRGGSLGQGSAFGVFAGSVHSLPNDTGSVLTHILPIVYEDEERDDEDLFSLLDQGNLSYSQYVAPSTDLYTFTVSAELLINPLDNRAFTDNLVGSFRIVLYVNNTIINLSQGTLVNDGGLLSINLQSNSDIQLNRDDTAAVFIEVTQQDNTFIGLLVNKSNISIKPKFSTLVSGAVLKHDKVIQNVKKIDLIRDIIKMGNFRILTDNQKKTVEFIQESDFLLTTPESWDDKVDASKVVDISLIQNQGAKELVWSHSNDPSDGFIADREDRNSIVWGSKSVELDSEYRKGSQNVYTSVFSTTIDHRGVNNLFMPVMSTQELKQDEPVVAGGFETNFDNRILIYDGLRAGSFIIDNEPKTQYPFAYHTTNDFSLRWDSEGDESIQLSSGLTIRLFGGGLVTRYYQNAIKRLNKSRLYTGWFFLSELDIINLDFRKPKIINGVHYYLNKVTDYKVNANQPTKVELISR